MRKSGAPTWGASRRHDPGRLMILDIQAIDTYYGLGHILHGLSLGVGEGEVVAHGEHARALPEAPGGAGPQGAPALRGRAADAGYRPRPPDGAGAAPPGRAVSGAGAPGGGNRDGDGPRA